MELTHSTVQESSEVVTCDDKMFDPYLPAVKNNEAFTTTDVGSFCGSGTEEVGYTTSVVGQQSDDCGLEIWNCDVKNLNAVDLIPTSLAMTRHEKVVHSTSSLPLHLPDRPLKSCLSDSETEKVNATFAGIGQPLPPGQQGDVPVLPRPRSPKRRTKMPPPPIIVDESISTTQFAVGGPCVTAVATGPFGTAPAVATERHATLKQQEAPLPWVTAVRCGQFGTIPAPTHAAVPPMSVTSPKSPKRRMREAALAATVTVGPTTPSPSKQQVASPKKRAGEAMLAGAKRDGVPLKIRLPDDLIVKIPTSVNASLPLKKRPVFKDVAGSIPAMALRKIEPGMPVKKRVPNFIFEEPPTCLKLPPGLM